MAGALSELAGAPNCRAHRLPPVAAASGPAASRREIPPVAPAAPRVSRRLSHLGTKSAASTSSSRSWQATEDGDTQLRRRQVPPGDRSDIRDRSSRPAYRVGSVILCVCIVFRVSTRCVARCNPCATRVGLRRCPSASSAILLPLVGRQLSWESAAFARLASATNPPPSRRKRRSDARIGGLQPDLQPRTIPVDLGRIGRLGGASGRIEAWRREWGLRSRVRIHAPARGRRAATGDSPLLLIPRRAADVPPERLHLVLLRQLRSTANVPGVFQLLGASGHAQRGTRVYGRSTLDPCEPEGCARRKVAGVLARWRGCSGRSTPMNITPEARTDRARRVGLALALVTAPWGFVGATRATPSSPCMAEAISRRAMR